MQRQRIPLIIPSMPVALCLIRVRVAGGRARGWTVEQTALVTDPVRGRCRDRDRSRDPEVPNGRSGVGEGDRRDMTIRTRGHGFSSCSCRCTVLAGEGGA
jgi:hypothetical protein